MQATKGLELQRKKLFIKFVTDKTNYKHTRAVISRLYKRKNNSKED